MSKSTPTAGKPKNMTLVGVDGELELYADKGRKNGILHDSIRNIQSDKLPLQVFFKWGNFEAPK